MTSSECHTIVREIGIDAGHRVPLHGSKCKALHGHRYKIEAACSGPLAEGSVEDGMVIDFGFLKDEMMSEIDRWCDHATILQIDDPLALLFVPMLNLAYVKEQIAEHGWWSSSGHTVGVPFKLYFIAGAPTAENLAKHWFRRLQPRVAARTEGRANLIQVTVHETPNCRASYPA